jgi:MFS family permease
MGKQTLLGNPYMDKNYPRSKKTLFLCLSLNAASQSFLLLSLPLWGRALGFSDLMTGLLLSLSSLLLLISAPFWGYASERLGRRPVLLTAVWGTALGPAGFALIGMLRAEGFISVSFAFASLLSVRLLQSALSGGLLPAAQAYLADATPAPLMVGNMGLLGASHGLGAVVGTLLLWPLAGRIAYAFWGFAILIALGAVLLNLSLGESFPGIKRKDIAYSFELRPLIPFFAITTFGICVYALVKQVVGIYLEDVLLFSPRLAMAETGKMVTLSSLLMVSTQALGLRVLRISKEMIIFSGSALGVLSGIILLSMGNLSGVFISLCLLGIAFGLILPGNLASLSLSAGENAQGRAAGLNSLGQGLGMSLGPLLGASLFSLSPKLPFVAIIAAGALISVLALFLRSEEKKREGKEKKGGE